tara:strand:+ start:424 stop:1467 length:1044 start_codon:yes stop_codon:yes gene_type:complete
MSYISFQPSDHFNTKLYTGNSSSTQAVTGVGFQPDWVWIKQRNLAYSHVLFDAVRGVGKNIQSNSTAAEETNNSSGYLSAFDSDGFTLSQGSSNGDRVNGAYNYVGWNWKANGQGSSNTDGSINTTYTSANTTSGFSISTYAGTGSAATVGHGLGAVPKMIIVKRLNGASDWMVYHESIGNDHRLRLNTTAAKQDNPVWNDTTPTSSVFSMNDNGDANASGGNYVAYAFSEKRGFSSINSYVGNGSTDGTFVYTGFKPAFVLVKNTAIADNWSIFDNKRIGYNAFNYVLYADITNVGSNGLPMDILSNGFKWRTDAAMVNGSGQSHIFMAFAEAPLVSSNGVPATAR